MFVTHSQASTTKAIIIVGLFLGFILSWGLIGGDEQGRVNVLHLVVIYVFLPIISLFISTSSLLFGKNWNFAKLVSYIPLWSKSQQQEFLRLTQQKNAKLIFFLQSQLAALSFSFASLIVLLLLLVTTDVNFIWRSTLLDAEQIFPLLSWLANPWEFWHSAQPSLDLLSETQDSRIIFQKGRKSNFGDWWQFILAAQLCYAFLLRFISIVVCSIFIRISAKQSSSIHLVSNNQSQKNHKQDFKLAEVINQINADYSLNNWCGIDENKLQRIEAKLKHSKIAELNAGPLATHSEQMVAERWQETQLIIVKGWEPPLAELSDFMQNGKGYLLPLDWREDSFRKLKNTHLNEWRRFIAQLPDWQLLQLEDL